MGNTPIIKVWIRRKDVEGWVEVLAFVDSGAYISVLTEHFASSVVGIQNIEDVDEKVPLTGIDGKSLTGYVHMLDIQIAGKQFACPMAVIPHLPKTLEKAGVHLILGRKKVFEALAVAFHEMPEGQFVFRAGIPKSPSP